MISKKVYTLFIVTSAIFVSCSKLEQLPQATASKDAVFSSEKGLELYANSFYRMLPSANNVHTADAMSDYAARRDAPRFIRPGAYSPNVQTIHPHLHTISWRWAWARTATGTGDGVR